MAQKKKTPDIRFAGFKGDWETKSFSTLVTMHARIGWQNLRKTEFLDRGDYYLITGTDFVDGAVDLSNCHYITKERYDQDPNIQIDNGSILITKDGTLGKVAFVKGLDKPATLNAGVFNVNIRDKNNVYVIYLFQYLKAPFLLDYVKQNATGGTIKHLNQNILVDFPIALPEYKEQKLIGDYLQALDALISLQQRKVEKLQNIKKSMLEKMFPKAGSRVPELRFEGFEGDWETKTLGEYLVVSDEKNKDNVFTRNDVFSVSGEYGLVNQIEFQGRSFAGAVIDNYGVVKTGDVVYTKSPLNANPYGIIKTNKLNTGIVSVLYAVYHPLENCNSNFVQTYFEMDARLNNYLRPLISKGAKNTINVSDEMALNGEVIFPSFEEQTAISLVFSRLDALITLQQQKLEKLQNIKKSMLEKMFV